jgi:hypothetical protein
MGDDNGGAGYRDSLLSGENREMHRDATGESLREFSGSIGKRSI